MEGLEKIRQKILDDASAACAEISASAEKDAKAALDAAGEKADAIVAQAKAAAEAEAGQRIMRAEADAVQTVRRAVLREKIDTVNSVIDDAVAAFKSMPADEYFASLKKIAAENIQQGSGVLRFSQKDLDRLPADFTDGLDGVTVDGSPAAIDGGFILAYGNIEYNCTPEALVEEKREALTEKIYKFLFPTEG